MDATFPKERVREVIDSIDFPLDKTAGKKNSSEGQSLLRREDVSVKTEGNTTVVNVSAEELIVINQIGRRLQTELKDAYVSQVEPARFFIYNTSKDNEQSSPDITGGEASREMFEADDSTS